LGDVSKEGKKSRGELTKEASDGFPRKREHIKCLEDVGFESLSPERNDLLLRTSLSLSSTPDPFGLQEKGAEIV